MRRPIVIAAGGLVAAGLAAAVAAQNPGETPFPAPKVTSIFVTTRTVTPPGSSLGDGVLTNYFAAGSQVVFRAFAGETKTGKVLTGDDVKYFYVQIPGQPPLKLTYGKDSNWPWSGTWTIPANFPLGIVPFKTLIQTKSKQYGSFVQLPVATSQLTVTKP